MKRIVALGLTALTFAKASAQDTTLTLPETVLTESRYTVKDNRVLKNITTITRKEIEASPAKNIQELLEYVAGVDIRPRGPLNVQADVSIRGGSFEQTLVLINGVKVIDPQTGHHLLNLPISINDIERIEILKGSGARVYGQNAFNGVINIITKTPKGKNGYVSAMRGDFNLDQYTFSGNYNFGNYNQRLTYTYAESDGYTNNSDFKITNGFYQSNFKASKNTVIDFLGGIQSKDFGANTFYTDRFKRQYEETDVYFGNLTLSNKKLANLKLNLYHRRHEDYFTLFRETPSWYENKHISRVTGADFNNSFTTKFGITSFGGEYRAELIESNNLGNHERRIASVFVEQRAAVGKFEFTPGFNITKITDYDPVLYPGANIAYHANDNLTLSLGTEKSFRVPSYTELFYSDPSNVGDSALKPEQALTHELNAKFKKKYYRVQASLYYRDGTNLIDWQYNTVDSAYHVGNVGKLNTYGAELNTTIYVDKLLPKVPIQQLTIRYNYQKSDAPDNSVVQSRYVFDYLKHQLVFSLTNRWSKHLKQTWTLRNEERVTYNSHWIFDSRLYWEVKSHNIFLEATNISNVRFKDVSTVILPGRWVRGGVSFNF